MSDSDPPANRRGAPKGNKNALGRGAPRGNKNASRHGLYSRWFTRQEHERLDRDMLGKLQDEENSLSIIIDRIYASMAEEEMNHDRYLAASRAVSLAVGRIESIHRTRRAIYENLTDMEKAAEELKYIPFEQDFPDSGE